MLCTQYMIEEDRHVLNINDKLLFVQSYYYYFCIKLRLQVTNTLFFGNL